uniref:C2 domain-containing protein n=1 Tax=Setaria digitata TaxID=48799 RepID=A0A915PS46_9BILA
MEQTESKFTVPDDLTTRIVLSFRAKNLLDRDIFSKSDPMCVIFLSTGPLNKNYYREYARTEVIHNSLNPEWTERIEVEYFFEEIQPMKFEIYDIDSRSSELNKHDFLGQAETTLAEIVGAPLCELSLTLSGVRGRKNCGELIVHAKEAEKGGKEKVQFVCKGMKLDKKDLLGKSDPFLKIYETNKNGLSQLAYQTEVVEKTLNPEWKPFEISVNQLCSKDMENHDYIGSCESTLNKLLHKKDVNLPLINEKKQEKKKTKYKNSGHLIFTAVTTYYEFSFLDYIAGGTELDFFVAVDMTASNGRVTDPSSLHFVGVMMEKPNEYHLAINAVAEICQHYNKTKVFMAAGFGAKLPNQNFVSHCFPLNLNTGSYFVHGVQGLLEAYKCCIMNCTLYGPTKFAPIIDEAAKRAALYSKNGSRYQILLIITDGCITDFCQTMNAIIAASYLPLSIIIIGVGGESFVNMRKLDSDNKLLEYQGRIAQRDIVQFVPLREFLNEKGSRRQNFSAMAHLAKEVLAEVPHQLTSYMKLNGIKPSSVNNPFQMEQQPQIPNESEISALHPYHQQQPSLSSLITIGMPATGEFCAPSTSTICQPLSPPLSAIHSVNLPPTIHPTTCLTTSQLFYPSKSLSDQPIQAAICTKTALNCANSAETNDCGIIRKVFPEPSAPPESES